MESKYALREPALELLQRTSHLWRPVILSEGAAMTLQADFASQDYFRNPAAAIEKLRTAGSVVEVRFPIGKVWATTTQALADRVLKDADTFTIRKDDGTVAGLRWWIPGIVRTLANSMLSMDEPDHKRPRDIVDEAFRCSRWNHKFSPPAMRSPMDCLRKEARPISSSALRASCRCR